jgi:hypothetical protein
MRGEGVGAGQALLADLEHHSGDHCVIGQGAGVEVQDGAVLSSIGRIAQEEGGGRRIDDAALVAGLARLQHPAILWTTGLMLQQLGRLIQLRAGKEPIYTLPTHGKYFTVRQENRSMSLAAGLQGTRGSPCAGAGVIDFPRRSVPSRWTVIE